MWPSDDEVILRRLLERNAAESPNREVFTFESGEMWTAQGALEEARSAADVLRNNGVTEGDVVGVFLPNGPEFIRTWWGAHLLGASLFPINTAFRGHILKHVVQIAAPRVMIVDATHKERLDEIEYGGKILAGELLSKGDRTFTGSNRVYTIADPHLLIATSGTTGPSKVWEMSMLQFSSIGSYVVVAGFNENDRYLVDLPLFHAMALGLVRTCQATRSAVTMRAKPSLKHYLEVIRATGATGANLVGSMASKLLSSRASPQDRDHKLKLLVAAPLPERLDEFRRRFGVRYMMTGYGSTELGQCFRSTPDGSPIPGTCGKVREGWLARIVDFTGTDVAVGEVGQVLVQPQHPALTSGRYVADPEATHNAWRGGWFHTGDLMRADKDGNYFFVDRLKDAMRRRGENISSFEVEAEVSAYPGVKAVACVAAPAAEPGNDEVKVWIEPHEGIEIDLMDLANFLIARMPRFMVPRYYEFADELPMSASTKVQKHLLRAQGNSDTTWDLEAHAPATSAPAQQEKTV
jgi:crotonobetaine/carnitine-CoA ligase